MQDVDAWLPAKFEADGSITISLGYRGAGPATDKMIDAFAATRAAIDALRELVELKDMKDREGPISQYRERKEPAWEAARRALAALPP